MTAPTPAPLLELRQVHAGYGPLQALAGVSMVLPAGSVVALLGVNGAGKSSTLAAIAGLLPVRAGSVHLAGRRLAARGSVHRRARAGILLVPEGRGIFPGLSVRDNLALFAGGGSFEPAIGQFPVLGRRLRQVAGSLSGGEQQMLSLSRALVTDPRALLIDELSLGLAPQVAAQLFATVASLRRPDRVIVVVEQFAAAAVAMADFGYVLARGQVTLAGDSGELAAYLTALGQGE